MIFEREYEEAIVKRASVLIADIETGIIEYCTNRLEELFNVGAENALLGETVESLIPERFREDHVKYRKEFANNANRRAMGFSDKPFYCVKKTGEEFLAAIELDPIKSREDLKLKAIVTILDLSDLSKL